jgi:hypothetical protein
MPWSWHWVPCWHGVQSFDRIELAGTHRVSYRDAECVPVGGQVRPGASGGASHRIAAGGRPAGRPRPRVRPYLYSVRVSEIGTHLPACEKLRVCSFCEVSSCLISQIPVRWPASGPHQGTSSRR